jgi:hypothetical protein
MKLQELNKNLPVTELCLLASKNGTDKYQHGYTKVYDGIMKDRKSTADIFEIGIYLGNSIKLWQSYFENGKICAIDNGRLIPNSSVKIGPSNENPSIDEVKLLSNELEINTDFTWIENERVRCYIADQRSESDLKEAFSYFGIDQFDFIIDDGHHYQEHQQRSLAILFKHVKSGGYYIIEDVASNENLSKGHYWGQKNSDLSDTTDSVFTNFIKSKDLSSIYLNQEEINYIKNNIEDIFIYQNNNIDNSPISCSSKLIVIKKR